MRRVGVIGSGGIAQIHLWAWRQLGMDVVVFSTNPDARAVAARHGGIAAASRAALVARVDLVVVCTPTPSHPEIVVAAAAAGRPVVCEKPLALTAGEARAMVAACEAAGVPLHPAHVVRYFPAYLAARRAVAAGEIGEPTELRLSRRSAAPRPAWFADRARSGGVVMDQLIHDIDYARWIAGEVVGVRAEVVHGAVSPEQRATVELTHAGGAISTLTGEWAGPGMAFATSFSLTGPGGTITDRTVPIAAHPRVADSAADAVLPPWQHDDSPYLAQAAEFLAVLQGGPAPRVTAADGVAAVTVAEAANESATINRTVALPTPT